MKYSKYLTDQMRSKYQPAAYYRTTTPLGVRLINYPFEDELGFPNEQVTVTPEDWPYTSAAAAAAEEVK